MIDCYLLSAKYELYQCRDSVMVRLLNYVNEDTRNSLWVDYDAVKKLSAIGNTPNLQRSSLNGLFYNLEDSGDLGRFCNIPGFVRRMSEAVKRLVVDRASMGYRLAERSDKPLLRFLIGDRADLTVALKTWPRSVQPVKQRSYGLDGSAGGRKRNYAASSDNEEAVN